MASNLENRKSEHLRIVAQEAVQHRRSTLLEDVHLEHQALPERDLESVDTRCRFMDRDLNAPLMITSMTGGAEYAEKLNHELAEVAGEMGIAFAVGSQRILFRHRELLPHFAVRDRMPRGLLLGNIGGVQLLEHELDSILELREIIDADGLCVHLNAAQELMQQDGNRRFRGILDRIGELADRMAGRLLVKETGAGLSPRALELLKSIGVTVVDVAGAGGTSWTRVESYREQNGTLRRTGELFGDWGLPTAVSTWHARRILGEEATIVASGGILTGLDAARAIALGADLAGFARSVLHAFLDQGQAGARAYIETVMHELMVAMLLTGSGSLGELRQCPRTITGELATRLREEHTGEAL